MIEYKGVKYKTREIYVDKNRGSVIIAELALNKAMGSIKDKVARELDETIAYYADPDEFQKSETELRDMLYGPPKKKNR